MKEKELLKNIFKNADYLKDENRTREAVEYLKKKTLGLDKQLYKHLVKWKIEKIEENSDVTSSRMNDREEREPIDYKTSVLTILSIVQNKKMDGYDNLIIEASEKLNTSLGVDISPWKIESILEELEIFELVRSDLIPSITERGERYLYDIEKPEGELTTDEAKVLSVLEERESELINSGLYETCITLDNLSGEISDKSEEEIKNLLNSLSEKQFLMEINGGYRSRVAEIVRLLYLVRQRFSPGGRSRRPRLIRSVKLKISPRKIPVFDVPIEDLMIDLERVIRNSSAWPDYETVWDKGIGIFRYFLMNIGITLISRFQWRGTLSIFQELLSLESDQKEKAGKILVAGTGTGKTEAFLLPHLLLLILRKLSGKKQETLLFCIYPRVRLAINQLERMLRYCIEINEKLAGYKAHGIEVGMMNQYVPTNYDHLNTPDFSRRISKDGERGLKLIRCPKRLRSDKLDLQFDCDSDLLIDQERETLFCSKGHHIPYTFTRELQARYPPDIMIITPETLHRSLMQNEYNAFFRGSVKTFVIDEVHIYEAIHGAQIALLLRRALKKIRELGGSTLVIGSSATLAVPSQAFKDFTSLYVHENDIIFPTEEELIESGVEYFLFVRPETVSLVETNRGKVSAEEIEERRVSPFSTLIQTLMCVMHNARRRRSKYKAIGFIDSVDSLYTWKRQQEDAEKNLRLFDIRIKPDMGKEGVSFSCERCVALPNIDCPLFIEGECWWFPRFDEDQFNWDLPLNLAQVSSVEQIDFEDKAWDVVLSTSSLEVGFDDPKIISIFQYKVPHTLASFLQRKGRGARSPDDRPITVLILNPYSSQDLYYFLNPERLIEGELREVPLNPENYYAQRAHFGSAVFDMLSTIAPVDYYSIDFNNLRALRSELVQRERDIQTWTEDVFRDVGRIYNRYYNHQRYVNNLIGSIMRGLRERDRPKNIVDLSDYVPGAMFEDLNIPHVRVGDRPSENIVDAMRTLLPGNPTNKYRLRGGTSRTYWCPVHSLYDGSSVLWINPDDCDANPVDQIEIKVAPTSFRPYFRGQGIVDLLRPRRIVIQDAEGSSGTLSSFFCPECEEVLSTPTHQHSLERVLDTTKAYPIEFSYLKTRGEGKNYKTIKGYYSLFGLEGLATNHMYYYGYQKGLTVNKAYLASQIALKTTRGYGTITYDPVAVSFHKPNGEPVFYGYSLDTEGFSLSLDENKLDKFIEQLPNELMEELRKQFFLYLLMSEAQGSTDLNIYQATKIGKVLNTMWSICGANIIEYIRSLPSDSSLFSIVEDKVNKFELNVQDDPLKIREMRDGLEVLGYVRARFYRHMPKIDWEDVLGVLTIDKVKLLILEKLTRALRERELQSFCKDVFIHSLKHVFQKAAALVSGVNERDLGGIIRPWAEFGEDTNNMFFIYETQKGGNGATRTLQNRITNLPGTKAGKDLMGMVDEFASYCPSGDVEDILNSKLFLLDNTVIQKIRESVKEAAQGRIRKLENLLKDVLMISPTNEILAKIIEIFTEKSISGEILDDYLLYKEIWIAKKLTEFILKRPVSNDELQSTITLVNGKTISIKDKMRAFIGCKESQMTFSNLFKLSEILQEDRIFLEEIYRRNLNSCQNACPECISTPCTYFNILIANLMLNRHILKHIILRAKEDYSVSVTDPEFDVKLSSLLDKQKFAYIRFHPDENTNVVQKVSGIISQGEGIPYIREVRPIITLDESYQEMLIHIGV